jgi:hypothetical protein
MWPFVEGKRWHWLRQGAAYEPVLWHAEDYQWKRIGDDDWSAPQVMVYRGYRYVAPAEPPEVKDTNS